MDTGDTAWMLTSTALVMIMLPGLALFYGGLVRAKNLLSVMSQVLGITAIAILTWALWDYSLAFSDGNAFVGNMSRAGFAGLDAESLSRVAGGNRDGGIRERLHDDHGFAAQGIGLLLLARRKESVEIEEQPLHRIFGR